MLTSLVLAASLSLSAPPAPQDDFSEYTRNWRRLESPHFLLVGNATDSTMRRVAERLEEFRAAVLAAMPAMAESYETETTVVVFRHEAAFRPFRPGENVVGYFTSGPYRNYIALYDDISHVIYHEYTHQLTRAARGWPGWLREGAAEFYATLEIRNGGRSVLLGRTIDSHLLWLQNAYVHLEDFLDPATRFESDAMTQTLYAEGWALFHYFQFRRPDLLGQVNRFIQLAAESGDVAEAALTAFGTDIETLNQEFATYIRNSLTFPAAEMTFAERLPEIEVSRSVEIPESEASFYLGDLLSHSDRLTEAEPWLERSLELGGEYEPALSALAALHRREGNSAEASGFLERALEAPDAGYLPHLLAAIDALVERPFDEVADVAEAQLRFVTAERPALPEGHYWLGHLLLRRPGRSEEALTALETAANLSGGEPRMRLAWAQGLAATGNDLQATGMLMGFLQTVTEPAYRARAEELLGELRQLSAAREAAAARAAQPGSPPAAAPPAVPPPDLVRDPAAAPSRRDGIPTPILPEGMAMREGEVNFVGCLGSFQLVLASAEGTLRLAAPDLTNVDLVSYSAAVSGEMPCGEIDPPLPARVIYRPSDGGNPEVDGTPVRIDFLP